MKYITLKGEKLNVDIKNYYEYLSPNYVFIPFLQSYSSKKESNEIVFKEELVLKGKNKFYIQGFLRFSNQLDRFETPLAKGTKTGIREWKERRS